MTNFIFKSPRRLTKNSPITASKLDILMKNVLYCTHRLDRIESSIKDIDKKFEKLLIDEHLKFQADNYYKQGSLDPED